MTLLLAGGWYKSSTGRQFALERSSEGIRKRWPPPINTGVAPHVAAASVGFLLWAAACRRADTTQHTERAKKNTPNAVRGFWAVVTHLLRCRGRTSARTARFVGPPLKTRQTEREVPLSFGFTRQRRGASSAQQQLRNRRRAGRVLSTRAGGSGWRHRRKRSWRKKSKATKERKEASRRRGGRGGGRADASGAARRIRSLKCGIGCGGGVGGVIGKCTILNKRAGHCEENTFLFYLLFLRECF